jgi:hypothetical protein
MLPFGIFTEPSDLSQKKGRLIPQTPFFFMRVLMPNNLRGRAA